MSSLIYPGELPPGLEHFYYEAGKEWAKEGGEGPAFSTKVAACPCGCLEASVPSSLLRGVMDGLGLPAKGPVKGKIFVVSPKSKSPPKSLSFRLTSAGKKDDEEADIEAAGPLPNADSDRRHPVVISIHRQQMMIIARPKKKKEAAVVPAPEMFDEDAFTRLAQRIEMDIQNSEGNLENKSKSPRGEAVHIPLSKRVHYGVSRAHGPHFAVRGNSTTHFYGDRAYIGKNRWKGQYKTLSDQQQAKIRELLAAVQQMQQLEMAGA